MWDKIIFSAEQLIQFQELWVREIHSHNLNFCTQCFYFKIKEVWKDVYIN
jgi:hypothetical protein